LAKQVTELDKTSKANYHEFNIALGKLKSTDLHAVLQESTGKKTLMEAYIPEKMLVKWSDSCMKNVASLKRKTQKS